MVPGGKPALMPVPGKMQKTLSETDVPALVRARACYLILRQA